MIAANPTDQIATVVATPVVEQDAQQYDWRRDLTWVPRIDVAESFSAWSRLAAYIERLEAEYPCKGVMDCVRCEHRIPPDECAVLTINARHKAERDAAEAERIEAVKRYERAEEVNSALLAEHEAVGEGYGDETADVGCDCLSCHIIRAHDNAERVIRDER